MLSREKMVKERTEAVDTFTVEGHESGIAW